MEEIKKLTENELSAVVGGMADADTVKTIFENAADGFSVLMHGSINSEKCTILNFMKGVCRSVCRGEMTASEAVEELKEWFASLVSGCDDLNTAVVCDKAKEIIFECERTLAL